MSECRHPDVAIKALTRHVLMPDDSIGATLLEVEANCTRCGTRFWFPGLPTGLSHAQPTTTPSGFRVTLPMAEAGRKHTPDPALANTLTRNHDLDKGKSPASAVALAPNGEA